MIVYTTNGERFHFILPGDTSKIRVQAFADLGGYCPASFLGTEDTMEQATGIGMRHSAVLPVSAVPSGLGSMGSILFPALKCWAIPSRPWRG